MEVELAEATQIREEQMALLVQGNSQLEGIIKTRAKTKRVMKKFSVILLAYTCFLLPISVFQLRSENRVTNIFGWLTFISSLAGGGFAVYHLTALIRNYKEFTRMKHELEFVLKVLRSAVDKVLNQEGK